MTRCIEPDNVPPNISDLNRVGITPFGGHAGATPSELVYHGRKFDTDDQLKQAIVLE